MKNISKYDIRTKKQIRDDRFQEDWGHLTQREQTAMKVMLVLKTVAVYGLFFSCGAVYAYIRCLGGNYA